MVRGEVRLSKPPNTRKVFKYKLLKTATLICFWICTGLFNAVTATTLVDFKEILQTDFDKLGIVMVLRTVGNLVGSLVGGILRDKGGIKSELLLSISAAICSIANILKPWARNLAFFGFLNFSEGFGHASANTVNNALLLFMWGKQAAMPVHAFHFGYGLGALLGPLMVKDFLSVRCPISNETSNTTSVFLNSSSAIPDSKCQNSTNGNPVVLKESRLEAPFCILGILLATISVALLTFYLLEKCSKTFRMDYASVAVRDDKLKTRSCDVSVLRSFFSRFAAGLFMAYMFFTTFEGVVYSYLFTFAYESRIGFSKQEAAYLLSAYWASYTCSRLISSFIAHFLTVKIMLFIELIGSLTSLLAMAVFGFKGKLAMWLSACFLGVFSAPVWPSGLAWADRYIPVTAIVVAATDVGAGIGGSLCSWLASHLIEIQHIRSYLYVASGGCACAIGLLIFLQIMGYRHGDRHVKRKNDSIEISGVVH